MGSGTVLGHGGNDSDQNPTPAVARPRQVFPTAFGRPVTLAAGDTVLCSGTLATGISFGERLAAAKAGGFTGISLWGRDYQVAREDGLTDLDIRLLLADHGLSVAELDPCWWWLPGASEVHIPPELDQERIFGFGERELFAVAEGVQGTLAERSRCLRGLVVPGRGGDGLRRIVRPGGRPRTGRPPGVPPVVEDPRSGDGLGGRAFRRSSQRRHHARRLALLPERTGRRAASAPFRARPSSASSCATRPPFPSPSRSMPRCTNGCCREKASWPCAPCWPISVRPARRHRSVSRCSPTPSMPCPRRRRAGWPAPRCVRCSHRERRGRAVRRPDTSPSECRTCQDSLTRASALRRQTKEPDVTTAERAREKCRMLAAPRRLGWSG